jgi:hypothetical protein
MLMQQGAVWPFSSCTDSLLVWTRMNSEISKDKPSTLRDSWTSSREMIDALIRLQTSNCQREPKRRGFKWYSWD